MKKKFKETGFGKFIGKIAKSVPGIAGDVLDIVTSPNPIGEGIEKVSQLLKGKAAKEAEAQILLNELEANRMQWEKEMMSLNIQAFGIEVSDRKRASKMYANTDHTMTNDVAKSIMGRNLTFVFALVLCNVIFSIGAVVLAIQVIPEKETAVAVGTGLGTSIGSVIGYVVAKLLEERSQVTAFCFGSTMGSKQKNEILFSK